MQQKMHDKLKKKTQIYHEFMRKNIWVESDSLYIVHLFSNCNDPKLKTVF